MDQKSEASRLLLTSENYAIWIVPMEAKLEDIDALDVVTGRLTKDQIEKENDKILFAKRNRKAYSLIVQNLDADNLALVSTTLPPNERFNGRAVWKLLQTKYAGNDLAARLAALDGFLDIEFSTVEKFCPAMRLANQKLVLAGVRLDNQIKILLMIRKLPNEDFRSFRDFVAMGFASESFKSIMKRLESYLVTSVSKESRTEHNYETASFLTQNIKRNEASSPTKRHILCAYCKKPGH